MWRVILSIGFIALAICLFSGDKTACAVETDSAGVVAASDQNLPVSQTYDPKDYYLTWIFHWHRNGSSGGSVPVTYQVIGCSVSETYYSEYYSAGDQRTFTAQKYCGPSDSHTLSISRTGSTGERFIYLEATAMYNAGNDTK